MSLFNDQQDEDYDNNDDDDMNICVNDCGQRIPSYLGGSVVVFVTLEDILMYIIIVCCFPPLGMCVTPLQDSIIVYGH